jgi:hypothetical protein
MHLDALSKRCSEKRAAGQATCTGGGLFALPLDDSFGQSFEFFVGESDKIAWEGASWVAFQWFHGVCDLV